MNLKEINVIIEEMQFHHHFQPLYNLNKMDRIGFEALFRTDDQANPEEVFYSANAINKLYELDTKSIRKAIEAYAKARKREELLFINVYPTTISNSSFPSFMSEITNKYHVKNQEIIFEINETEIASDIPFFQESLNRLKNEGYLIAIDDVGKGAASLRAIIEIEPHLVKMDRYFAFDLAESNQKQEMVKSVLSYCANTQSEFLLEGIEKENDLKVAQELGVPFGQGFLLGRPGLL